MANNTHIPLGINMDLTVRSELISDRPCVLLSSGYGVFGYDEPVQLALLETLQDLGIGWVQYQYPERNAANGTTDLLLSSGLNALRAVYRWARFHVSGPVGLFGISFGANISLEAALLEQPAVLLLINPVFDYVHYRTRQLGEGAMETWEAQGRATISYGQDVRSYYRFIEEARRQNLLNRVRHLTCRVVACQASDDPILSTRYVERFATACPQAITHVIPGADHGFTDPEAIRRFVKIAESALQDWYRADVMKPAA